jgi:hypothetical protein
LKKNSLCLGNDSGINSFMNLAVEKQVFALIMTARDAILIIPLYDAV